MKHLTETQLNEYFDGELGDDSRARAEAHLAACGECRQALEELCAVASLLAALPEEMPTRDIATPVLAKLPQSHTRLGWKLVLAVQAGVALGLSVLVIANSFPLITLPNLAALLPFEFPTFRFPTMNVNLLVLDIQPSIANIIFLAISAIVLCGVGNAVLLRGKRKIE